MKKIESLPQSICDFLSAQTEFAGINFITAYSSTQKPHPLTKTTVAVGVKELKIENCAIGSVAKSGDNTPQKLAKIKIFLNIYTPFSKTAIEGYKLVPKLFISLIFNSPLNIDECQFGESTANVDSGAFLTEAYINIKTTVTEVTENE